MQRLFLAVTLPDVVREDVAHIQARLREAVGENGIRWVAPEQFHYTLKFLGDVEAAQLPAIVEAAQRAATSSAPFLLEPGGLGVFPAQRSPQVLWIGVQSGVPVLTWLAEYLERELAERGFEPETKPFRPHLTLARMKTRDGEESVAKTLPTLPEAERNAACASAFEVTNFVLMQSELRPGGPVYTAQKTFAFRAETE